MEIGDLNELERLRRSKYVELSEVIEAIKKSESCTTKEAKKILCTLELEMLRPVTSVYYENRSEITDCSSSQHIKAMSYLLGGLGVRDVGEENAHQYDDVSYFWEVPVLVEWCKARGINVPKSWGEWMSGTYPVLIERGLCLDELKKNHSSTDDAQEENVEEPSSERCSPQVSDEDLSGLFDPLKLSGIAKVFYFQRDESANMEIWRSYAAKASSNGLKKARISVGRGKAESTFNLALVGDWLVEKSLFSREAVNRKLGNNLPKRNAHFKDICSS